MPTRRFAESQYNRTKTETGKRREAVCNLQPVNTEKEHRENKQPAVFLFFLLWPFLSCSSFGSSNSSVQNTPFLFCLLHARKDAQHL